MAHPYMANSTPDVQSEMLAAVGADSIGELFEQIPEGHRLSRPLKLPQALSSEVALQRHLGELLSKNESCQETLSFLGAGCWQHHVPAACKEVVGRREWLTSVFGSPMSDHGRNQAWFEFCSQLGELVGMDLVGMPVYSWGCAAGHAIRLASRLNGRREVLVVRAIDPERLSVIRNYCETPEMASHIKVTLVDYEPDSGRLDLSDLARKLSANTAAAIYFEVPSYVGIIDGQAAEISRLAHAAGAEVIVGVDPISLGVLAGPADYGADIVVGSIQPLGVPMNCGGGCGGFIASRDEARYAREYPTFLVSITDTVEPGERGFGLTLFHQTSYGMREKGKDWTGNSTYLWTIAGAAYMAMMGPQGFRDIGELILRQAHFAASLLGGIPGVRIVFPSHFFKEFVVNFDGTGKTVDAIDKALRAEGIFGGKNLSREFPELGQSALYCVTEIHSRADLERLAAAVGKAVRA
ncbi:MAG: aminomethyl-transferring glycine dehydrogenase subunit GcvPA [Rhizobiaceae bacterium]|nr:aminomethyl-transferring glycine dehydrogenase subunit GcvPA [Rhizobiaceae bacterium]